MAKKYIKINFFQNKQRGIFKRKTLDYRKKLKIESLILSKFIKEINNYNKGSIKVKQIGSYHINKFLKKQIIKDKKYCN